jgi:hypothetical protein
MKVRGLIYQNPDGSFADPGTILGFTNPEGGVGPIQDITLNNLTITGPSLGLGGATITNSDGIDLIFTDASNNSQPLTGWYEKLSPDVSFGFLLPGATTMEIAAAFNNLLSVFFNKNIFIRPVGIPFSTPLTLVLYTFPTGNRSNVSQVPFSIPIGSYLIQDIVTSLNTAVSGAHLNVRFDILQLSGNVLVLIDPGYTFAFTDGFYYGNATLFFNHLGLTDIQPSYEDYGIVNFYTSQQVITPNVVVQPPVPSAPAPRFNPPLFPHSTFYSQNRYASIITIQLPDISGEGIEQFGIYLQQVGDDLIYSWDLVPATNRLYNFTNLAFGSLYNVFFTQLTAYDESPLSISSIVGLPPRPYNAGCLNVLTSSHAQLTPIPRCLPQIFPKYTNNADCAIQLTTGQQNIVGINGQVLTVCTIGHEVWTDLSGIIPPPPIGQGDPPNGTVISLSNVDFIVNDRTDDQFFNPTPSNVLVAVELEYYSSYDAIPYDVSAYSDARFIYGTDLSGVVLFTAYANRIVPKYGAPFLENHAIGSPVYYGSNGPSLKPTGSTFITEPATLNAMFGLRDASGNYIRYSPYFPQDNVYIDKTKDLSFSWYAGIPNTGIFNCQLTKFVMYFGYDGVRQCPDPGPPPYP